MVNSGCQDTDWVSGEDKDVLDAILWRDGLILAPLSVDNGKCGYLGCNSGWFRALKGAPRSQMVDIGCQDTDWVGRNHRCFRCNSLWDGLILATFSLDKGKYGYLGCISGWFGALRGAPRVKDG